MPSQLSFFAEQHDVARVSIWLQLPADAQQRVTELFAELLLVAALTHSCTTESSNADSIEDPAVTSGP